MYDKTLVIYGKVIRDIRQNKKLSQEELAERCGLHRTYISDVELGKRNVSLENIIKISKSLDVNVSKIFIEVEKHKWI